MQLPPLNSLRAFEAAARHNSFLLAANELHVSAASISRFIKVLEADLGVRLFLRKSSGVVLTVAGQHYYHAISPHLNAIADISASQRQQQQRQTLHIFSIPAIAETWLVSQLWTFQQRYKKIEINLVLDDRPPDFLRNENSIWLRYDSANQAGCISFALPQDSLTLVCSPEVAKTLSRPADIFNHCLLVDLDWQSDWLAWLNAASLPVKIPKWHTGFERYSMVINAAIAGSGVAIGHTALLKSYLDMGTLVRPFAINASTNKQFLAIIDNNQPTTSVKHFINWFLGYPYYDIVR
ncbi:LysR substrate-binding domain-containing protein [Ostreibacterium oceani]|uniref:LysR family transcriptional regulator n=1 Tax=Ostreibacterium oceani TaxID=2654998 RepID=A0A6N7F429_9GAMM|nr:LysR substrate-binding domain-containing protein [Ostreibacterium oceani]MPV86636.1 LysR family transcriptional regulator [Ostreibacterium oceani]